MAQHDMNIANQGFPATRADLNNALQALVSNSSGTSAPSTTFANQWWYDTTNNKMYIRNEANNAWIEVFTLDQTSNEWQLTTGVIQAKDSDGLALKTDDGTTRLFIKDSDGNIGIATTSPDDTLTVGGETLTYGTALSGHTLGVRGGVLGGTAGNETDIAYFGSESTNNNTIGLSLKSYRASTGNDWTTTGVKFTFNVDNSDPIYDNLLCFQGGNVGINDSSPSHKLDVNGNIAVSQGSRFYLTNDSGFSPNITNSGATGSMLFSTNNAERVRISENGNFLIGSAYDGFNTRCNVRFAGTGAETIGLNVWTGGSSGVKFVQFVSNTGSGIGSISQNGTSAVAYNTSSDYRLKENITDVTDGITRVKQLQPKRFNFIDDPDRTVDGFIAHEAQLIVPEAITGEKDAMKDEGYTVSAATGDIYTPATEEAEEVIHSSNVEKPETLEEGQQWRETTAAVMGTRSVPDYQGIDQSKLVPLLTAALQEAIAKIEALETRVAALEG